MLLAHSQDLKKGVPVQSYAAHVGGVVTRACEAAQKAAKYSSQNGNILLDIIGRAAEYHDLGKLDDENQKVLSGAKKAKNLPIQHTDAGTAFLLNVKGTSLDAALVRSHHIGLPDFVDESNKSEESVLRDDNVRELVNASLLNLVKQHSEFSFAPVQKFFEKVELQGNPSVFFRVALSCLVDGDHTDTAIHYKDYPAEEKQIELKPAERLAALDGYVAGLGNGDDDDRSRLRSEMYHACRDSIGTDAFGIASCDSPVGSGKTTAVMAHLLKQALNRGLRKIIVVLPFTNIITQSVEVYRKALVLTDENPSDVVAEIHHRADFQDLESRHLTALWKAPIIVTTAVTFFETLASNTPSTLRRLHNLPGSAIFVDESHAALPAKLLPVAWSWIKVFAAEWGCYWVLASGSLSRFWQIPEFENKMLCVPEIVPNMLRIELAKYEISRINYPYESKPKNAEDLVGWVCGLPGPRIVILNTVQSAAAVAQEYCKRFGRETVEHLSTALSPADRKKTLNRIKIRLLNKEDENWTLIATSCVEAGVDISFCTGVRELGSLVSLLQTAGRVNRHGGKTEANVWTIRLAEQGLLKAHPGLKDAVQVLRKFFDDSTNITPSLCTEALQREIRLGAIDLKKLRNEESNMQFPQVEKGFQVIEGDTRVVVIDSGIVERLEMYESVDWRDLQNASVQIWKYKLDTLKIPEVHGKPGVYKWSLAYDDFLGYMAGVLPVEAFAQGMSGSGII